jgi:hypothetical protein
MNTFALQRAAPHVAFYAEDFRNSRTVGGPEIAGASHGYDIINGTVVKIILDIDKPFHTVWVCGQCPTNYDPYTGGAVSLTCHWWFKGVLRFKLKSQTVFSIPWRCANTPAALPDSVAGLNILKKPTIFGAQWVAPNLLGTIGSAHPGGLVWKGNGAPSIYIGHDINEGNGQKCLFIELAPFNLKVTADTVELEVIDHYDYGEVDMTRVNTDIYYGMTYGLAILSHTEGF